MEVFMPQAHPMAKQYCMRRFCIFTQVDLSMSPISSVELSPDTKMCLAADSAAGLMLLDVENGLNRCEVELGTPITGSLTDGVTIVLGTGDQKVLPYLWAPVLCMSSSIESICNRFAPRYVEMDNNCIARTSIEAKVMFVPARVSRWYYVGWRRGGS